MSRACFCNNQIESIESYLWNLGSHVAGLVTHKLHSQPYRLQNMRHANK